ncbi:hypothetical protein ABW20_dc0102237 [Dactylellina cionopaga]|nr:hypothetical protein ABW20_dc0102237 [Dactylellina cionopaga]
MPPAGTKRPYSGSGSGNRGGPRPPPGAQSSHDPQQPAPTGPYIPMFTEFRNELDEHHDRRERIIKSSRDITAASKKIIFTLQRLRPTTLPITSPLPHHITTEISQYESKIQVLLASLLPDLQDINGNRYLRQISPGLQEYIEAIGFRHYLLKAEVIEWEEAEWYVSGLNAAEVLGEKKESKGATELGDTGDKKDGGEDIEMVDAAATSQISVSGDVATIAVGEGEGEEKAEKKPLHGIKLSHEDYILGLFDMTGEMMRFAITSVATTPLSQLMPTPISSSQGLTEQEILEKEMKRVKSTPQTLLQDLRILKLAFENLDLGKSPFGRDADKKMEVMQECVRKVEYAFYGMVVRGSERPEGWVAELEVGGGGD